MEALLKIGLLVLLILITYQDFKYRAVSWVLFPLGFAALLWIQLLEKNHSLFMAYSLVNLLMIAIHLIVISLYFSLKEKEFVLITKNKLGLGDVLCLIILCMGFSPINFICFMLLVLITGLVITLSLKLFIQKLNPKIPLASYLSMGFIVVLILEYFTLLNPYEDHLIAIIN